MAVLFAAAHFLMQANIHSWLASRDLDMLLIGTVNQAEQSYIWCLLGAAGLMSAFFYFDKTNRALPLTALTIGRGMILSFFVYYIVLTRALQFPFSSDDAYIDFRYVRNWLNGWSFDYNPGEKVMGFTSHLHLWLLTILGFVFHTKHVSLVSHLVNIGLQCGTFLLTYITLRSLWSGAAAMLAAIYFAINAYQLVEAINGKESAIVCFLIMLSIWAWTRDRRRVFAWTGPLLFLTRPEGFLWLGVSGLSALKKWGLSAWKLFLIPMGVILAWYAFLFAYFGTILPHGGVAKHVAFAPKWAISTFVEVMIFISRSLFENPFQPSRVSSFGFMSELFPGNMGGQMLLWSITGVLIVGLLCALAWKDRWLVPFAASTILLIAFFSISNPYMFSWYYAWFSMIPVFVLGGTFYWLCCRLPKKFEYKLPLEVAAAIVAAVFLMAPLVQLPPNHPIAFVPLYLWDAPQQRLLLYAKAAQKLNEKGAAAGVPATIEPGIFGYVFKGPILDLDALCSDVMLKYYPLPPDVIGQSNNAIPPDAIAELKPKYILFFPGFARHGLLRDIRFRRDYTISNFWPLKIWNDDGLYMYRRNKQ